jgi:hypothetical protein
MMHSSCAGGSSAYSNWPSESPTQELPLILTDGIYPHKGKFYLAIRGAISLAECRALALYAGTDTQKRLNTLHFSVAAKLQDAAHGKYITY